MDVIVERCAALDVHKKTVMACVRAPDGAGGRGQELREFRTFTRNLHQLREWLVAEGVTQVALECGLLRGSFVPPKEIARLRDLTRYRAKVVAERGHEAQRLQKLLEDAGIKLDSWPPTSRACRVGA